MSLMLDEISEQPAALERTIREERAKVRRLGEFLKARDIDLIVLVARGSSDNAAFYAAEAGEPVRMAHVLHAVRAEYAKLERPLTSAEIGGWS